MKNPLVSVIIPNYCHAKFLDQRIQSVLNQTYQNFEVIILDDCSPDDGASKAVIEKYRKNPHVSHIVYNDKNSGSPYKQWSKGVDLAKGELMWVAESDDYADGQMLEILVTQFENHDGLSIAFCRSMAFSEKGIIGPCGPFNIEEGVIQGKKFIHDYMVIGTGIVNASSAIFLKTAYLSISDIYTTFKGSGDHLFWIELAEKGNVAFIDKTFNFFRQHHGSTTQKLTRSGLNQIEDKRIFDYICEHGYILKHEIRFYRKETMRINVFELHGDKSIQKRIYKAWGFSKYEQLELKFDAYIKKIKKLIGV